MTSKIVFVGKYVFQSSYKDWADGLKQTTLYSCINYINKWNIIIILLITLYFE